MFSSSESPFNVMSHSIVFMILLFSLLHFGCSVEPKRIYIKVKSPEEMKKKAFELCGQRFKVLAYEEEGKGGSEEGGSR